MPERMSAEEAEEAIMTLADGSLDRFVAHLAELPPGLRAELQHHAKPTLGVIVELANTHATLMAECAAVQDRIATLAPLKQQIEEEYMTLQGAHRELRAEHEKLQHEHHRLKGQVAELRQAVTTVTQT